MDGNDGRFRGWRKGCNVFVEEGEVEVDFGGEGVKCLFVEVLDFFREIF